MNFSKNCESGYILGLVMIFFIVFTILGLSFIKMGGFERMDTYSHYQRAKAYYYAEGGIHKGMWRINHVASDSATFSDSTVAVVYDSTNQLLTATGKSGGVNRSIKATLTQSSPYQITKWNRL